MNTSEIKRPILRYHGGKWKLAPWIISHFGPHDYYTEAFGGAASVLLRKPQSVGEVYNDLNGDLANLFRVLRAPDLAAQLSIQLALTPYSREEFELSYGHHEDPVERARRIVVRSFMSFGSAGVNEDHNTGFRSCIKRGKAQRGPAYEWASYPELIPAITARLRGVVLEQRTAEQILTKHDSCSTLHYVDPPYPLGTRGNNNGVRRKYRYEMTDDDHRALAVVLHSLQGMVVLSGYACELYDNELFPGWERKTRETHADGARARTEVLWLNPLAAARMNTPTFGVFAAPSPHPIEKPQIS
jgi:DNA adenine methylase